MGKGFLLPFFSSLRGGAIWTRSSHFYSGAFCEWPFFTRSEGPALSAAEGSFRAPKSELSRYAGLDAACRLCGRLGIVDAVTRPSGTCLPRLSVVQYPAS
jgi:hypothetical protein